MGKSIIRITVIVASIVLAVIIIGGPIYKRLFKPVEDEEDFI